jgi:hypothetical protein
MLSDKITVWFAFACVFLGLGFVLGVSSRVFDPVQQPIVERFEEAERYPTGELTLERNPNTTRPKPLPKAKDAERIRTVIVEVPASPEPQTVQLDIQQQEDGSQRITAATSAGEILGGVDIPIGTRKVSIPKWNVGLYQTRNTPGIFALYTRDRWSFGAMLDQHKELGLMLGFRF